MHHRRYFTAILACALSLFLLSSCGLEEYVYLYPPSEYYSSGTSSLTRNMSHNTLNADSSFFLGYQVYYKIYGSSSLLEEPALAATEASSIESSSSPDVAFSRLSGSYGYKPIIGMTSGGNLASTPIVRIADSNKADSIYASFDLENGTVTVYNSSQTSEEDFDIYRSATDNSSSSGYKSFTDLTTALADEDVDTKNGTAYYWIRVYGIAYGLNTATFESIYSSPAVLADTIYLGAAGSK